ncbi:MAG: putative RND superfamily exporter protein [Glaciecola sp.]|jgi:predicted RND superfamily exporter protein
MSSPLSKTVSKVTVSYRRMFSLFAALLTVLLASGIFALSFNTSFSALLSTSDPYLEEFNELDLEFPNQLTVTYVFLADEGSTVFSRPILNAMQSLKTRYEDIPMAQRVTTLVDFYSPETQRRLFTRTLDRYSDNELAAIAEIAIEDRLLTNNLLSRDASISFAPITLDAREATSQQRGEIANAAIVLRDQLRSDNPGLTILVNSDVLLEQSSQQAMVDDLTTLLPIVILICVLTICYCFRSVVLGLCILTHTLFTMICTIGILGLLGYAFNSISIIAPLVVVIIAVANSVHIISIYQQALSQGHGKEKAMEISLNHNFKPVSLAALTTAIGFSSLNMCSSPAIQDFGQIVAFGIVFAYLLTFLLVPALLIRFTSADALIKTGKPFLQGPLKKISLFTQRNDKGIFWSCTALAVVTLFLLPLNETDFNRIDFIAGDTDLRDYYDVIDERMNRGPGLNYGIKTGARDSAIHPELLRRIDTFSKWLSEQTEVESATSIVDVIKTINRYLRQDKPEEYVIPDSINTIGNHLAGYQLVQSEDFPLLGFINEDYSLINLFINVVPSSNQQLLDLDEKITKKFAQDFPELTLLHGSSILLFSRMDELVTIELLQGYSVSLLLITLSLIVGLRSIYFGILSVLPNLLPATIVFGIWAVLVGQLDPFVMMLFSISIGLVVDDTVHLLSHYLDRRRAGADKTESIDHAILTAGPALTITTLVLALGTTILIGANTIYFQQAAKLLVPIVVLALILDLLYLPTILKRFDNKVMKLPAEN